MAYLGKSPVVGNFQVCDAITVVNGQAGYTLQVGGSNVSPESANHMLVSLNGILQAPTSSFTVSGSTLTFASNLATGDVIDFVILLGNVLDLGVPSDGVITNAKLAQDIISGETALTAEPATTDELLLSDAGTLKRIDYSLITNTPAFHAFSNTNQESISDNTWTKITMNTELFDSDGCYDHSSNYRFTPDVAGKYYVYFNWSVYSDTADSGVVFNGSIYKNGSNVRFHGNNPNASYPEYERTSTITSILDMNGSSDYVEAYVRLNVSSGDVTASGNATGSLNYFGAYKLTGA